MDTLQQIPAETTAYMIAGYTVIFGVMLAYIISLIFRNHNLEQEYELLCEIDSENIE